LALCRTLMGAPALLIVDEPCEGLAPQLVQQVAQCLRALQAQGTAVLLIDQQLAPQLATRALLMERGRITHTMTQAEMQEYCSTAGK
ncbi:MAG: ABC transporter ATP-binding protein, partial [Ottowia sp.]|nr:ABC transporter ATP-binding protein [Ottowia sp.]